MISNIKYYIFTNIIIRIIYNNDYNKKYFIIKHIKNLIHFQLLFAKYHYYKYSLEQNIFIYTYKKQKNLYNNYLFKKISIFFTWFSTFCFFIFVFFGFVLFPFFFLEGDVFLVFSFSFF